MAVLMLLTMAPAVALGQDGALDPAFGDSGKVVVEFPPQPALAASQIDAFAVAAQPDGKIVVVGRAGKLNFDDDFALVRLDLEGTPDPAFGQDGFALTDFAGSHDGAVDVVIQPDGRIVAAGWTATGEICADWALARYDAEGRLDASFGDGGRITANFTDRIGEAACHLLAGVAVDEAERILIAGSVAGEVTTNLDIVLARYNAEGRPDTTFGDAGVVLTDVAGDSDFSKDMVLQDDGKIVVVESSRLTGGMSAEMVIRYTADGSLDPTFGEGGLVTAPDDGFDSVDVITVQPDGKAIVVGRVDSGNRRGFALARFNADGSLDTSFGTDGLVLTDFSSVTQEGFSIGGVAARAVVLQEDGRIVVAGDVAYIDQPGQPRRLSDFLLARFNPDGSFDTTFGASGLVFTDFDGGSDGPTDMMFQDDGKLVVTGDDFQLARYLVGSTETGVSDKPVPKRAPTLEGSFPNPFREQTTIRFMLPEPVRVRLAVYDVLGREVKVLVDGPYAAGMHTVKFEADELPSGTYLCKLTAGALSHTRFLTLLK